MTPAPDATSGAKEDTVPTTSRSFSSFLIGSSATLLVVALIVPGVVASTKRFQERRSELDRQQRAEQQAEGMAGNYRALYTKYPTPEIGLAKIQTLQPGQSAKVSLPGKYAPGTVFLTEHDGVDVGDESAGATSYSASLAAAADAVPGFVRIHAFAPVSGANNSAAVAFIGPVRSYEFATRDGWTVKMTPQAKVFEVDASDASLPYEVAFFRAGNATPVETMSGLMRFEASRRPGENVFINLQRGQGATAAAEFEKMMKTMGDPQGMAKMSPRQQEAFMNKLEKVTEAMMAEQTSPDFQARQQEWQNEFGCSGMNIWFAEKVTASVSCGQKVGTLQLELKAAQ